MTIFAKILYSVKAFLCFFTITASFTILVVAMFADKLTPELIIAFSATITTSLTSYQIVNVWQDKVFRDGKNQKNEYRMNKE